MSHTEPFFREAGCGPGVVCAHSNASSSAQWRDLLDLLAPDFRVLAADSYGAGRSPEWPSDRVIGLGDEVALLEPVLARAGAPLALVGHSYGGAVALVAALANPGRVGALAVYEPTLFSLVDADSPPPNAADGIRDVVAAAGADLDAGNRDGAARRFIDYWMGTGAWDRTPAQRQPAIAAATTKMRRWAHALFSEATPLTAFRTLDVPVLYMVGRRSPVSARDVGRLLVPVLPRVEVREFEELGHMGPITHPQVVNRAIQEFLVRVLLPRHGARPAKRE